MNIFIEKIKNLKQNQKNLIYLFIYLYLYSFKQFFLILMEFLLKRNLDGE